MNELWDIYDINKRKTGRTAERGVYQLKDGEYHLVVNAIVMNSKNEILISKRVATKKFGGMWECCGGSVLMGETSLEGILRELKEEMGLRFEKREAIYLTEVEKSEENRDFKDLWLFMRDINAEELTFPDGEATEARWVDIDTFMKMFEEGKIVPTVDFGRKEYELALNAKVREAYNYIGKEVTVKIDRKFGSKHPNHGFEYMVNYGYVPETVSGDGEELDAYVLGVDTPIEEIEGKCIAVIHRTNDDDDKLIVIPKGLDYGFSNEFIREKTNFQEKWFESEIIR